MFYGIGLNNDAKARHNEMLREAALYRLAHKEGANRAPRNQWSSALLIWLGRQLIGWGRQLNRSAA